MRFKKNKLGTLFPFYNKNVGLMLLHSELNKTVILTIIIEIKGSSCLNAGITKILWIFFCMQQTEM